MSRFKIYQAQEDTQEKHCTDCAIRKAIGKKFNYYQAELYCLNSCPIGIGLKKAGQQLEYGVKIRAGEEFTQEMYEELSEKMSDRDIAKEVGISTTTLSRRKKVWGLTGARKMDGKTKEDYYRFRELGMKDQEIANAFGVAYGTLHKWKVNNVVGGSLIDYLLDAKTKDDYFNLTNEGLSDIEIAKKWGVSARTLRRWRYEIGLVFKMSN